MKYWHLLRAALMRKKARTLLTLLSVAAAFALFGMLDAVRVAFQAPATAIGIDRLIVSSKLSLIQPLPFAYLTRIRSVPGVRLVSYASWFGGIYQEPKNFFANIAVDAASYLKMYPEIELPPEQRRAFLTTRTGAIVGRSLADRFGWKVGDRIPLTSTLYPHADGSEVWTFEIVGIFHGATEESRRIERQMLFQHAYLDEGRAQNSGTVGWYLVRVKNANESAQVAQAIDRQFENSTYATRTQSERDFQLSFAKQIGDIGLIVKAIMGAVFFTLILLTGNTMAQSIRERIPELAVLKTLGFTDQVVSLLVLAEALMLLVIGGMAGMLAARGALPLIRQATDGQFDFFMRGQTWVLGVLLMLLIGLLIGLPPALKAMRLSIVDALAGR